MQSLFESTSFQEASRSICPKDKQVMDPFQFNFIMQVPGQTVATHIDGAYFMGATRKQFPQWLLACMVFSGLFQDKFVDQVQVVSYLHDWEPSENSSSGQFIYYNNNSAEPEVMLPVPRSAALIDGSKTAHAALVYKKEVSPPALDKNKKNQLHYIGNNKWQIYVGDEIREEYHTNDLRISIVYRARCFRSEEERHRFNNLHPNEYMTLEGIFD